MSWSSCWYLTTSHLKTLTNNSQGPSTSTYGAIRASLGYPDPFTIKYVEIGNEDFLNGGTDSYVGMFVNSSGLSTI